MTSEQLLAAITGEVLLFILVFGFGSLIWFSLRKGRALSRIESPREDPTIDLSQVNADATFYDQERDEVVAVDFKVRPRPTGQPDFDLPPTWRRYRELIAPYSRES